MLSVHKAGVNYSEALSVFPPLNGTERSHGETREAAVTGMKRTQPPIHTNLIQQ